MTMNLMLLGPPGGGKGTQAARLREEFELTHLATGDLLRRHRAEGTALGREAAEYMSSGRLVPDALVTSMLIAALEEAPAQGFLLDGFPRTVPQADALADALEEAGRPLTAVVLLEVDDAVIVERISGRVTCPDGHVFHLASRPPAVDGECDHACGAVTRRDDDHPDTVQRRLDVYAEQTAPLAGYYGERGLLVRVDGDRPEADVYDSILASLAKNASTSSASA
jgi:adenylate kinase